MLVFVVAVLAVYRVAHLVAFEDGPFDVCLWWRTWLHDRLGPGHWVYRGFTCPLCLSFWLAWVAAIWVQVAPYPLTALGIAGAVLLLHKVVYKDA